MNENNLKVPSYEEFLNEGMSAANVYKNWEANGDVEGNEDFYKAQAALVTDVDKFFAKAKPSDTAPEEFYFKGVFGDTFVMILAEQADRNYNTFEIMSYKDKDMASLLWDEVEDPSELEGFIDDNDGNSDLYKSVIVDYDDTAKGVKAASKKIIAALKKI